MSNPSSTSAEAISLPQGGGGLQGLGEKFSPDPHTGTGNFSVPLVLPPGRNGFQPQLALTYSTGAGNGPFGLGWGLGVPAVTRKSSAGVPRYRDGAADPRKHDTFILAGAEDLVPVPGAPAGRQRYRPRTEGLFARVERLLDEDVWEVRTRDGLVSVYGAFQSEEVGRATLADPAAPGRVFAWKLTETRDPFGNLVRYEYLRDAGSDPFHHWDQLYLHRVLYADHGEDGATRFLVSVELEYEERPDPFSEHRAGFEVRTRLRCSRIVTRTHAGEDRVVRTLRLVYQDQPGGGADALPPNGVSLLARVLVAGHDGERTESVPPLELAYTRFQPDTRDFFPLGGRDLPAASLADPGLELVDLFGTGLPDLVEVGETVRYWRNRGDGGFDPPRGMAAAPAGVRLRDPGVQLVDANGDGRTDLLVTRGSQAGYYPLRFGGEWDRRSFRPYAAAPTFSLEDAEVRLVDLDGDGVTDAIRSGQRLECFFNHPEEGWRESRGVERRTLDVFPDVSFSDARVRFADMGGDGLQDMVVIHDGSVEYWPAMGWGDWGRRVVMRNSPRFPDGYDPRRILLGDVDGDGCADLVYVEDTRVTLWINRSGNGWSEPVVIRGTPPLAEGDSVRIADVMGMGIAGLLWSFDASRLTRERMVFLQLAGAPKPYLLSRVDNRTGAVTEVEYAPSTRYYLADRARGAHWRTPLPFPVQVVAKSVVSDAISGGRLTTEYVYHHGYWDGAEREFRGFGRVDQLDTESFASLRAAVGAPAEAERAHAPPVESRTWFHQGPVGDARGEWVEVDYSAEFWQGDPQALARPAETEALLRGLPRRARRDALRALRGRVLRTEQYARDGSPREHLPYTVGEELHALREEDAPDPAAPDRGRIFFPFTPARRTTQWERGEDPQTSFTFTGDFDAWGHPRRQAGVAVPRGRDWRAADPDAAEPYLSTLSETEYAVRDDEVLLARPVRATSWAVVDDGTTDVFALRDALFAGEAELRLVSDTLTHYDGPAFEGLPHGVLGGFGAAVRTESLVLTDELLARAYVSETPPYLAAGGAPEWPGEYPRDFRERLPAHAGYVRRPLPGGTGEGWYAPTERKRYDFQTAGAPARGLVLASRGPLGGETRTAYDRYAVRVAEVVDPAGNATQAVHDYRVMQAREVVDANGNVRRASFTPLGLVEATWVTGKAGEGAGDTPDAPSTRFVHDFHAFAERGEPNSVRTFRRVHHAGDAHVPEPERGAVIESVEYSDGFGRLLQARTRAEDVGFGDPTFGDAGLPAAFAGGPGQAVGATAAGTPVRVAVSGWQVYDNKGRVVEKYEPFFATGWGFSTPEEGQRGEKAAFHFDALGRTVRTVRPDGSEDRVVYGVPVELSDPDRFTPTPWEVYTYDAADNAGRTHPGAPDAWRAHRDTPSSALVDALGRTVRTVARRGPLPGDGWLTVRTVYDLAGNPVEVRDELGRPTARNVHDLARRLLRTETLDAGVRRIALDAAGNPLEIRDGRGALVLHVRDAMGRPVRVWARDAAGQPPTLRERLEYGDELPPERARAANLRGRLHRHFDEAGLLVHEAFDFRGHLAEKVRRTLGDAEVLGAFDPRPENGWEVRPYRVHWEPPAGVALDAYAGRILDAAEYRTSTRYDALGRVESLRLPLDAAGERKLLRPRYNRAGALERVELNGTVYVERIAYSARGQRLLVAYGNGVMTRCAYHPRTFRLTRLRSEHYTHPAGAPLVYAPASPARPLQDVAYEYDPAGNVLAVQDRTPGSGVAANPEAALEADPVLSRLLAEGNALVRRFEYDALGRLRSATGRQCKVAPNPRPWADALHCDAVFRNHGTPGPDNAPRLSILYRESYAYDHAGNLVSLAHRNADASWTRHFGVGGLNPGEWAAAWPAHGEGADWDGAPGNRLSHASDAGPAAPASHAYDAAGNLVRETTSRHFTWDYAGRLQLYRTQTPGAKPSVYAYYLYDAAGQRVKKITAKQGSPPEVTVYLDGLMEHRRVGSQENHEIHVMDDRRRIAVVRVGRPLPGDNSPEVRYHLGDHLSSSALVVDGTGAWINREEYTPFGESTLGSFARKRYRFTGKERDEESGFYYHGARYYAPWLCRWATCDPAGPVDGLNLYRAFRNNPMAFSDPTGLSGDASGTPATPDELHAGRTSPQYVLDPIAGVNEVYAPAPEVTVDVPSVDSGFRLAPTWWDRGGGLIAGGGLTLGIGVLLLSGPPGWLALTAGSLSVSAGGAAIAVGTSSLSLHGSGQIDDSQAMEINRAGHLMLSTTSSPGSLIGGPIGVMVTGDVEGLERGAMFGGLAEGGLSASYGLGRMGYREFQFGRPRSGSNASWSAVKDDIRAAYGIEDAAMRRRANDLFYRNTEYIDLSHFAAQRDIRGMEWLYNRPWNIKPMWATNHALVDPHRFQFMSRAFKNVYEGQQMSGIPRMLHLAPDWMLDTGFGALQMGHAALQCTMAPEGSR